MISEVKVAATAPKGLNHRQVTHGRLQVEPALGSRQSTAAYRPLWAHLAILNDTPVTTTRPSGLEGSPQGDPAHPGARILLSRC